VRGLYTGQFRISGRAFGAIGALAVALSVGGCVDATSDAAPSTVAHRMIEPREGVSLADATVTIVSIEGAPESVAANFSEDLRRAAKSREIVLVEPRKAKYLVRGYLSATSVADGATLEYVWDVYGPDKQREQRLNDVVSVKGTGDDPWTIAGETALENVASRSADDLAAFLSHMPEAKPLAPVASGGPATTSAALSYAPAQ
jgi:hypothetical protein